MSGEDVASADYSSSFSSLEGSSFLSDSRKSSTWGKSGFSSLETLDQDAGDDHLVEFLVAKSRVLSAKVSNKLTEEMASGHTGKAVPVEQDKNCTAFCERKIRFLSQEDQTTIKDSEMSGDMEYDNDKLADNLLENTRAYELLKISCLLQRMKLECRRSGQKRHGLCLRSRELETEILERKFVCQHVCALQREKIEAQFEEQIMKSSAVKLAEVIAGCPDPRAQGQAVWIQLLHESWLTKLYAIYPNGGYCWKLGFVTGADLMDLYNGTLLYHAASAASCSLACYLYLAGRKMHQRVHKKAMHLERLQEGLPGI